MSSVGRLPRRPRQGPLEPFPEPARAEISEPCQRVGGSCPADTPARELNPLLAMGNLFRDYKLIGEKLKALHMDEGAYHGNLQVTLSALKRMQDLVATMLKQCEGS
jgi:hypothetical protein